MPSIRTAKAVWALALSASAWANPIAVVSKATDTDLLGRWQALAPIALQPRQEHTAVALNATTIALIGGIIPGAGGGGGSPSDWATTDMFQLFNTETSEWTLGPPLPFVVNHPNTVVVDGSLYLLGGLVPDATGNWVGSGESHVLHNISSLPSKNNSNNGPQWQPLAAVPSSVVRGSAAVASHGGRIYLAGGMRRLIPQDSVDSVVAYDIAGDTWLPSSALPPRAATMPEARDHAGSAVVDGTLYVLGGRRWGQNNVRDTVFALKLDGLDDLDGDGGWVVRPSRMPTARGGVAAAAVGDVIYTFGGEGNPANGTNGVFPDTQAYDVRSDSWVELAPMQLPRHGSWAVALPDGGVYVPGGGIRQGGAAVDSFDVFWPPPRR